jgi:hypothetical protein
MGRTDDGKDQRMSGTLQEFLDSPINSHRVREDGTMEDYVVETYFHLMHTFFADAAEDGTEYVEVSFDDGGIDGALRIPKVAWISMADKLRAKGPLDAKKT